MSTIVSIHSYRGGTGKSNLIANLASSIVQQGKGVVVVDTDIQSPGLHVLFGMDPQNMGLTLNDYLYGRCSIEQATYDVTSKLGSSVPPGGALYLIPSSIKASEITRVLREGYEVNLLTDGFRKLMKAFRLDYLFIDGDHSYEGVKSDFETYRKYVRKGGLIAFHDILGAHPKRVELGVKMFWEELKPRFPRRAEYVSDYKRGYAGIGVLRV